MEEFPREEEILDAIEVEEHSDVEVKREAISVVAPVCETVWCPELDLPVQSRASLT